MSHHAGRESLQSPVFFVPSLHPPTHDLRRQVTGLLDYSFPYHRGNRWHKLSASGELLSLLAPLWKANHLSRFYVLWGAITLQPLGKHSFIQGKEEGKTLIWMINYPDNPDNNFRRWLFLNSAYSFFFGNLLSPSEFIMVLQHMSSFCLAPLSLWAQLLLLFLLYFYANQNIGSHLSFVSVLRPNIGTILLILPLWLSYLPTFPLPYSHCTATVMFPSLVGQISGLAQ